MSKFILEFDEAPALVFVQEQGHRSSTIYQDGVKVRGVRSIVIRAAHDDVTTHEIEYATGCTATPKPEPEAKT